MTTQSAAKVAPLADRVVIKPLEETEQMRGGLVHPRYRQGKAAAGRSDCGWTGPIREGERVPMDVKVGDKVLYGKYSGTEVTIEGGQYLILRESDVLAVHLLSVPTTVADYHGC